MGSVISFRKYPRTVTSERKYEVAKLLQNVMKEERSYRFYPPSKPRKISRFWLYFSNEVKGSAVK